MEEKKLISALKDLHKEFAVVVDGKVVRFTVQDIRNLIQRKKAEIKRMKIWLKTLQADMKLEVTIRNRAIGELQQQVDELTKKCSEIYWFKQYEKAEKETANEIFERIFEALCSFSTKGKSKEYNEGYIQAIADCDERIQTIAKEHGVEVE